MSAAFLAIDSRSPVPPYEQLRSQVAAMAADRLLPEGTRLPAIRALAADLAIAPNTVARAYRELEETGVVETRGRHGTFVLPPDGARVTARQREARLADAALAFAREVRLLGVDRSTALASVRSAIGGT
ncbi:MAG: GntR family transcriptional regulator [Actinomycetota bacterium]|nr:GntR family transcriptional regulator [Actinomycetota bacterium]